MGFSTDAIHAGNAPDPRTGAVSVPIYQTSTYRLFEYILKGYGLTFTYVDTSDLAAVERAFTPQTRLLFVETPTNPLMVLSDLAALASLARGRKAWMAVDNTFMTPYYQRPLEFGAHL